MDEHFLESVVKQSAGFVFKKMENESILVELVNNVVNMDKVFTLNELGTFIYSNINGKNSNSTLLQMITNEFDVTPELALNDLKEFIANSQNSGIIEVVKK